MGSQTTILARKVDFGGVFKAGTIDLPKNGQKPSKIVKNHSNFAQKWGYFQISGYVKTPKLALLSNGKFGVLGPPSYSGYIPMDS